MSPPAVLPSVSCHGVGTLIAIISQLNTLPACAPVNASMAASRPATRDSGSGWLAMPFLCDSFIHYSTPVLSRRTTRAVRSLSINHGANSSVVWSFIYERGLLNSTPSTADSMMLSNRLIAEAKNRSAQSSQAINDDSAQ